MVYVVTPVYNRKELTGRFLKCLLNQTYKDIEVVIIDDGSTDGTSDMIENLYPNVTLIRGTGDLWWSGGTNEGLLYVIEKANDDDFVLIINDDLEFDSDYIEKIVGFAHHHPKTLVGSIVADIKHPNIIWDGGRMTNWFTAKDRILNVGKSLDDFEHGSFFEVSQLTGRGMLAPVQVFKDAGMYDAVRFKHRGDTEFPVRASKFGYKQVVFYDAIVRSHVDNTYEFDIKDEYHLSDIRRYFFDFRSSFWLKFRFYFALKTAKSPFQFISFLTCDMIRITVHFLKRLKLTSS
ncbi:MAG: glycosyltransferase family 2 protein [Rhodothermales bacterium]